uniref:Protein kinase domain-containing protein n=1 Tax=Bursaphelenchus xylophilus TaxID=6326 RepID=A0A1I7S951_BURXY
MALRHINIADRSLLDSLVAHRSGDHVEVFGAEREAQVRIFAKQLLTALQYMHHRNIAHLDLRPEAVLLQDDHLRLADFGQSRHLIRGKVTGNIKATPEFVSPEIAQGQTVTLAADMWSAGSLIYVLLTGVSPFLGDNDRETLANINNGNYLLDSEPFNEISNEAKDFLQKLLLLDPSKRMTVDQALSHDWLADPSLRDAKLRTDCLREFKYHYKWLERRVFVQQTPSDQLTQMLESPRRALAQIEKVNAAGSLPQRAEPYVIYDYNAIKERDDGIPEFVPGTNPQPRSIPKHIQEQIRQQIQRPPPPFYDPQSMPQPGQDPRQPPPPGSGIPPNLRPEEILAQLGIDPRKLQGFQGALPPPESPRSPNSQRKRLEPQAKGETPSQRSSPKPQPPPPTEEEENQPVPPIQLIRGENRQIQYELATRNLSDISEECSVAGSVASLDDVQDIPPKDKHEAHSRSTTPRAESDTSTPLASPTLTIESNEPNPIQQFFGDHEIPPIPELNDPKIPVGAPIFLEELNKGQPLTVQLPIRTGGKKSPASLSPASNRSTGTKSPIQYSPGQEHQMECVIAVKYGKQRRIFGMGEEAKELQAKDDDDDGKAKSATAHIKIHDDGDLERLVKDPLADLEKYRVKNYYKDDDIDFERREMDVDDYPWESNYQIGPETLLLATKGANFNARVRDYRRMLWGDGAPLVSQGILGFRNQDITVRERRRFTDLIREDPQIAKSVEKVDRELGQTIMGSVRRNRPELIVQDGQTTVRPDGCHRPIFKKRLHDVCLIEDGNSIILDCQVIGNPRPEVAWYHQGSALKDDQKFKAIYEGNLVRLIINKPMFVDGGEYSCTATNELGSDSTSCRLISGSEPGRPGRPEVTLASDTEVFIVWEPPEHRPSMFGISYRLESRPAGDNDHFAVWTVISDKVEAEFVVVKHLSPGGIYQFRVTACNGFGWGEPSLTSRIIRTHTRGVPKLNMDILRREHRLQVVAMPQKMTKAKSGLTEICEEEEEEEDMDEKASSVSSVNDENLSILNEEPTNRFDLLHEIFRGKFSLVREAADKNSGKRCCMKVRPFDQTEFDALLASQHENVVKLVAGYKKSNCLLLFTESLAENVFDRFVATDPYTEEHIALTVRQICAALHWIHFKGVLHLDVQPNNVMFAERRSWLVKLIDFDRAGKIGNTKEINPKTLNPEWAPPEILKGEKPTTETDVWGMGIVCFCILAGFHPFSSEGDNVDTIRNAVLTEKCDPNLIPVQASQEALRFATWALKKDPRRRMRTEEALAHRFLANDATMVRRRENIKYSNSRIQRTSYRTLYRKPTQLWDGNVEKFGEGLQMPPPRSGMPLNGAAQFGGLGPTAPLQRNGSAGSVPARARPREV